MAGAIILAHDIGTSGTKTSIVRADGVIEDSVASAHETRSPQPGWAEQEASDWWEGVCHNTRALMERNPRARDDVAGIGVSGQMLGCLPLDAEGNPLRRSMIHSDCRATAQTQQVAERVGAERFYGITGNILDPRSPLCKIVWLKENEPSIYARTARFVQSKDYVVGRMVGAFETTDLSDASHASWIDITERAYARDMLRELGIAPGKFPELHAGTDVVGSLTGSAAQALGLPSGIPVVAGGGDGACATAGAGAVNTGDVYCCIGTTAWIASTVSEPLIDPQQRVFCISALDGERIAVHGTIQAAGRSVDWVMDLLGEEGFERFDEMLAGAPPGSDGLLFLPYLEGERSPIFDPDARGVFFGITPAHGREHFLRATVEGVSFALRSVLEVLRESTQIPALRLIGGGGQSETWQQILADVWDARVQILSTQSADATSVGAALAAGVGVGLFASMSEAAETVAVEQERVADPERAGTYRTLFGIYADLYPRLETAFARLQECL